MGLLPGGTHRNLESCAESVSWGDGIDDIDRLADVRSSDLWRTADLGTGGCG